jgi:hypothetical protein
MLYTQHVSGIIMPIIRSRVKDDKPHTVFYTALHLMALVNHSNQVDTGSTSSPQAQSDTTSAEKLMRFVVLYCTPDDGHNDA